MTIARQLTDRPGPEGYRPIGVLGWPALLRKLDRADTSYRE